MKPRQGLRFLKSLHTRSINDGDILKWIEKRRNSVTYKIRKIDLKKLKGWTFDDKQISHDSGRFFQIKFIKAQLDEFHWDQPIINQPEIGILGFITSEIDGVLKFLVQAKIEPGNINIVQLSPTVQSTKSNFSKVHGGSLTPYVEYFLDQKSLTLVDQLQSEQGSRFYRKRNRNIIIEIQEDIEKLDDYIWLTLGDIISMTKYPNTVNMDSRTVISCIHYGSFDFENYELSLFLGSDIKFSPWISSMIRRDVYEKSHPEILSIITEFKFRREFERKKIPLLESEQWIYENGIIKHIENKYFDVVGYNIHIENRETSEWNQPMIRPKESGICCFFAKLVDDVFYLLVQLKDEIGSFDGVEMAPTIQTSSENLKTVLFYDIYKKLIKSERVLMDIMQSEEGGRFYKEQNRNIIIDVTEEKIVEDSNYIWMSIHQIKTFLQYNNYVNIQTRSIISSLPL